MPDYSKGKIYTIRCKNDPSLIYVGSTIQSLAKRMGGHKDSKKNKIKYPNHQLYTKIEDWKDWYIELYENCPCDNKEELLKREGEIIREIGTLNRSVAGRTKKEWEIDNADKRTKQKKEYHIDNADKLKIREIAIGRRDVKHCECGGRYSLKTIRKHERSKIHQNYLSDVKSAAASFCVSYCSSFC